MHEGANAKCGERDPDDSAEQSQGNALGEELAYDASARGAERRAQADLALPSSGAARQQRGDVRRGHEEDQRDGDQQHGQWSGRARGQRFL